MGKVIVSDIFGRTPALEALAETAGSVMSIIDPYGGKHMGFHTEQQAYECFMTQIGMNAYCEMLQSCLKPIPHISLLIGFSVGAAAVWQISETLDPEKISRVVCFYGSQVRHATDIVPNVKIDHILPNKEPGFCIDDLAAALSGKKEVTVHKTPYLHGFMNALSPNFHRTGYGNYLNRLR